MVCQFRTQNLRFELSIPQSFALKKTNAHYLRAILRQQILLQSFDLSSNATYEGSGTP